MDTSSATIKTIVILLARDAGYETIVDDVMNHGISDPLHEMLDEAFSNYADYLKECKE